MSSVAITQERSEAGERWVSRATDPKRNCCARAPRGIRRFHCFVRLLGTAELHQYVRIESILARLVRLPCHRPFLGCESSGQILRAEFDPRDQVESFGFANVEPRSMSERLQRGVSISLLRFEFAQRKKRG